MIKPFYRRNEQNMVSIRYLLVTIYLSVCVILVLLNFLIFFNLNRRLSSIDEVYESNMVNAQLEESLRFVQDSMTDYMMTKSTDSLEAYYSNVSMLQAQKASLTKDSYASIIEVEQNNISYMIDSYLELTDKAIASKRGRNIRMYRENHDKATEIYNYISSYIYALNNEQFAINNRNYDDLLYSLSVLEHVSIVMLGLMIVVGVTISYYMTKKFISPLTDLTNKAVEFGEGNFDLTFDIKANSIETFVLTETLNEMAESIRSYIEQVKESAEKEKDLMEKELRMEAELNEAKLNYFQAQISPHFLFNTLNAGAQLAMMEEADRTYSFINVLADFFRYNIQTSDVTTLREELNLIEKYIYILNVRFSGEIHVIRDIDESLTDVMMPTMILQPIVENCVNYGIRNVEWEKKIYISVYDGEDEVLVSIADNGVGIDPALIPGILSGEISDHEKSADSNGVGIPNVDARLQLFFHTEHAIEMISEGNNQGTEVIVHLKKRGNEHV